MNKFRLFAVIAGVLASTTLAAAQGAPQSVARAGKARGAHNALLQGITLSPAERARLAQVKGRYQPQQKSLRAQIKPAVQQARVDRQKGDTAAARALLAGTKSSRTQLRELRKSERTDVRSALTPEHQRQFDSNVRQVAERHAKGSRKGRHRGAGKLRTRPTLEGRPA